jgi:hypothetical protein
VLSGLLRTLTDAVFEFDREVFFLEVFFLLVRIVTTFSP